MVGAIADWFAVTALFKHPLGLPVPHTALIPQRKDELGRSLEEFVGENFLQEDIIRERIAVATISQRVGQLARATRRNARRVVDEVADVAAIGLGKVRDEHIADLVERGAGAALPRGADRAAARAGCSSEMVARRPAPRAGRPGARGAPPLAGATTRRRSPRSSASGRPGGRRRGSTTRSPRRIHLELVRWVARHPRRPAPPRPPGAGLDAGAAGRRPAARPRDPGPHRARSRSGCSTTRRWSPSSISLWNALRRALLRRRSPTPRAPCAQRLLAELSALRRAAARPRRTLRGRLDGIAADVAVFARRPLRQPS